MMWVVFFKLHAKFLQCFNFKNIEKAKTVRRIFTYFCYIEYALYLENMNLLIFRFPKK